MKTLGEVRGIEAEEGDGDGGRGGGAGEQYEGGGRLRSRRKNWRRATGHGACRQLGRLPPPAL